MRLTSSKFVGVVLALLVLTLPAQAAFIVGAPTPPNEPRLGAFTGSLNVASSGANDATLTVSLTNTSPALNGGYLTAFVFNNPSSYTIGLTSSTSSTFKEFLDSNNDVSGAPYGQFDFGVTTNGGFQGGKSPDAGLAVGQSATFVFSVTGAGAGSLSDSSFLTALSTGRGAGKGFQFFAVRYRGFEDDGSDKVAGVQDNGINVTNTAAPAPASLVLAALGIPLFLLPRLRRRATITA